MKQLNIFSAFIAFYLAEMICFSFDRESYVLFTVDVNEKQLHINTCMLLNCDLDYDTKSWLSYRKEII